MKKLIAVFLAVIMVFCVVGCDTNQGGKTVTTAAKRTAPLKFGINAHVYEQRNMDPASTLDYIADMTKIMGFEYYRLSTPLESMFTVAEGDVPVFKKGMPELVHKIIKKMKAAGVKKFVACSDAPIYPFGYEVTCSGAIPDPAVEKDMYIRWVKLYARAEAKIIKEFPEITHLEPMNEPDLAGTNTLTKQGHIWGAEDDYDYALEDKAHVIADLQYYIYKETKAVNPDIIVTTPGLSTYGEALDIMDYIYEAIESGAHPFDQDVPDTNPDHYFDCINFHKYLNSMTVEKYFEECDYVFKASERHNNPGKTAIITEWGFTDYDNEGQEKINGENITKQLEMFDEKMPYLEAALVYCLNDLKGFSVSDSEDNFGLFTSPGDEEKPSCPKPVAINYYKFMHKTDDVSPLYKYCPELMPK